jgi:hypothetical protein
MMKKKWSGKDGAETFFEGEKHFLLRFEIWDQGLLTDSLTEWRTRRGNSK